MNQKSLWIALIYLFMYGCAGQETVPSKEEAAMPKGSPVAEQQQPADLEEIYGKAEAAFKERDYDETVRLLSGPANNDPGAWKINILLAKAQTEQCAILKARGDESFEDLIKTPYNKARAMNTLNPYHPEPYYIASRCLLINGSTDRAARNVRKALKLAPENPEYWKLKGEICEALARQSPASAQRYIEEAQKAYEMERRYR